MTGAFARRQTIKRGQVWVKERKNEPMYRIKNRVGVEINVKIGVGMDGRRPPVGRVFDF